MALICVTCINFAKRDTSNDRLYLGRCPKQNVTVMICPPDNGKEECHDYKLAPDAKERVAAYKAWRVKHPLPVYETGHADLVEEIKAKPVPKQRGGKKR